MEPRSSGSSRPTTMRAAHVTSWCDAGTVADAIVLGDVPAPPAAPRGRQVTVRVRAAAVNVDDVALLQDTAGGGRFFHSARPAPSRPLVGGCEFAGVVAAVGPAVRTLRVGDRVCGVQDCAGMSGGGRMGGVWADFAASPEGALVRLPDGLDFREAAAVGMAAHVAGDMIKRADSYLARQNRQSKSRGRARASQKKDGEVDDDDARNQQRRCLVIGASGGLGTVLLQLLRQRDNVHTVAVCSAANSATVQRLGADEVLDYTKGPISEQLAEAPKFDLVFDFVGGTEVERTAATVLRRGGQFITAVGPWQGLGDRKLSWCEWMRWAGGIASRLMLGNALCGCLPYRYAMSMEPLPLNANNFHAVVVEGEARGEIALEVNFNDTAAVRDAIRRVATRHSGGKVIINMNLPS